MPALSPNYSGKGKETNWFDIIPYHIINSSTNIYGSECQLEACMAVNVNWRHVWQ